MRSPITGAIRGYKDRCGFSRRHDHRGFGYYRKQDCRSDSPNSRGSTFDLPQTVKSEPWISSKLERNTDERRYKTDGE